MLCERFRFTCLALAVVFTSGAAAAAMIRIDGVEAMEYVSKQEAMQEMQQEREKSEGRKARKKEARHRLRRRDKEDEWGDDWGD